MANCLWHKKQGGTIMNYYIADTHFDHKNIIAFDNRPFFTLTEMNNTLIENWNNKVSKTDTVFILGDFCWSKEDRWIEILSQLQGSKILIQGNHDLKQMSATLKHKFQDIAAYKEITDNGRKVIMSHYPIPFYKSDYNNKVYHLYGHVHNTVEEKYLQELKQQILKTDIRETGRHTGQYFNCWCGFYNYTPVSLDEILDKWKDKEQSSQ